jgi:hypothetical protein
VGWWEIAEIVAFRLVEHQRNAQGLLIQDDHARVQLAAGVLVGLADVGGALPCGFRVRIELRQLSTDCESF